MARGGRGEPAQDGALAVGVTQRATEAHPARDGSVGQSVEGASIPLPSRLNGAFVPLKWTSFIHSCIYLSLLVCAFALGKPEPETFTLGLAHGLLWIGMSLACIAAARLKIVTLRLAVAVAVLGGIGPFFGSIEFLRARRSNKGTDSYY